MDLGANIPEMDQLFRLVSIRNPENGKKKLEIQVNLTNSSYRVLKHIPYQSPRFRDTLVVLNGNSLFKLKVSTSELKCLGILRLQQQAESDSSGSQLRMFSIGI